MMKKYLLVLAACCCVLPGTALDVLGAYSVRPPEGCVHKDVTSRLEDIDPLLAADVKVVLEKNKAERHIRGGIATKKKYELQRLNH